MYVWKKTAVEQERSYGINPSSVRTCHLPLNSCALKAKKKKISDITSITYIFSAASNDKSRFSLYSFIYWIQWMLLASRNVILNYLLLTKHISRCQTKFPLLLSSRQLLLWTECAETEKSFLLSGKLQKIYWINTKYYSLLLETQTKILIHVLTHTFAHTKSRDMTTLGAQCSLHKKIWDI